jgi:hypothetical protein
VRGRHVIAILVGCAIGGVIAAVVFGSDSPPAATRAHPAGAQALAAEQAADRHDRAVTHEVTAMHRAAIRGDRAALAGAERNLERLAETDPTPAERSTAQDPFRRAIDELGFKRAPLFVLQVRTTDGSHRISAGVDRYAFCLTTPAAREAAVRGLYDPLDKRLRADGVTDLRFVVVALTQREPTAKQELAIASRGAVRLTARGRTC